MKNFILTLLLLAASCSVAFGLGEGTQHRRSVQLSKRAPPPIPMITRCKNKGDFMLTFHDGPSDVTGKLLDKLIQLNVPATFFLNGDFENNCIYRHARVIRKAFRKGITLGHHTWNHTKLQDIDYQTKLAPELNNLDKAFRDIVGIRPRLFSPPSGFTDQQEYLVWVKARGYDIVKYKIDTQEKDKNSSEFALQQFKEFVDRGEDSGISLSRDLRLENVEEVIAQAVEILRKGGEDGSKPKYNIVNAETCLGYKPFYQQEWEGRKDGDLPGFKKDWEKAEITCRDHLKA